MAGWALRGCRSRASDEEWGLVATDVDEDAMLGEGRSRPRSLVK